jgi:hypothetical protein
MRVSRDFEKGVPRHSFFAAKTSEKQSNSALFRALKKIPKKFREKG